MEVSTKPGAIQCAVGLLPNEGCTQLPSCRIISSVISTLTLSDPRPIVFDDHGAVHLRRSEKKPKCSNLLGLGGK